MAVSAMRPVAAGGSGGAAGPNGPLREWGCSGMRGAGCGVLETVWRTVFTTDVLFLVLQIGNLENYYHFYHSKTFKRSTFSSRGPHTFLRMDPQVKWLQQQEVKRRVKRLVRSDPQALNFNDPIWPNMWYLHCGDKHSRCRSEMNVQAAWKRGYTGKNVVVTILDDGIERNHPDLAPNYDSYASYDVNGNDYDPSPRYDASNENKYVCRCLGLPQPPPCSRARCLGGRARTQPSVLPGIRMLDGDVTDVVEAKSLGVRPNYIDIYSASWGPDDDGKTVDGPGRLAKQAFEYGIKKVTTDLRQRCTDGHTGTSVSAPMVAGIIALALEANSQLTWRDVQHLLVKTSRPAHLKANDWKVNGAGHKVSHLYGFGLVDAEALVLEAKKWTAVPSQHTCVAFTDKRPRSIPVVQTLRTTALTLLDHSNEGFSNWEFMTVHSWGEKAEGEWTLEIQDMPSQVRNPGRQGKLKEWSLVLYGTAEHPYHTFSSPTLYPLSHTREGWFSTLTSWGWPG
ncbi:PREDICTED: proprotein convertase subtilisin/kexin type 6 [Myotis davidii]|uniref:proprotein convertase subtilisin/kexin type 6 n=1 Tax=Myotis davidii TaxID=225400 RepID=UPI000767B985|nr:PREDICTED: proprotein convertase subtilisin/kexin type 6 [Myotis davidii]